MRTILLGAACALVLGCASTTAQAEAYVDYTPQKGHWTINAIEVDPNHVDDYLTGLRTSQVTAFEVLKRRGLIDDYKFLVRKGYMKGAPSVLIMTHVPSDALDDADQARDQAVEKEIYAAFSKDRGDAAVKGYEKYRTFIDNSDWQAMDMRK
jgi:type IV pilus biogenesis protein CpaD/CtpE